MSKKLGNKFEELEKYLLTGSYEQARVSKGPFVVLLYPPEEETQVRDRIETLQRKLESDGWNIQYFEPEPLLYEHLESIGKSKEAFEAEREDHSLLRSKMAQDLYIRHLTEMGKEYKARHAIFVRRAGGFYPHVNIHALQEKLSGGDVKMTTVFFIPAVETEDQHYFFMGKQKTQKYRGKYL